MAPANCYMLYVGYQQNISATNPGDLPRVNLPSNALGLPTPDALGIVLRNAERLLSSHAASALSVITSAFCTIGFLL